MIVSKPTHLDDSLAIWKFQIVTNMHASATTWALEICTVTLAIASPQLHNKIQTFLPSPFLPNQLSLQLLQRARAMSARKRDRDVDVQIKVAKGEPLQAEAVILRAFSNTAQQVYCAKALPADTDVWDVSNFIYSSGSSSSSEPFSHKAVKCWLGCVYSCLNNPATELDAEDMAQLSTAEGLHEVLSFAHAVGSRDAVLRAACSQLSALQFVAELARQQVSIPAAPNGVLFFDGALYCKNASVGHNIGDPITAQEQRDELSQQVAAQAAALLQLAHVLDLQQLFDVLHNFIFWAVNEAFNILLGEVLDSVFTEAVLTAALGSSSSSTNILTKEAYISSMLVRPGGHVFAGSSGLFKRSGSVKAQGSQGGQQFKAQMLQDFAGVKAGDKVTVELDLVCANPTLCIKKDEDDGVYVSAQVVLGKSPDPAPE